MSNNGILTGMGIGAGIGLASLLLPLIPLLVVGGGIYLLNKFLPEEAEECESGQNEK